jgi:hypothetical protein
LELPVRIETVKVSGPSVEESGLGVILNCPVPLLIVKDPDVALKSAPVVVVLLIAQYNIVPLDILVVSTLKVPEEPSSMEVGIVPKVNEAAPIEVSLTVTLLLVATIVPVGLSVRTETVKVSGPSL